MGGGHYQWRKGSRAIPEALALLDYHILLLAQPTLFPWSQNPELFLPAPNTYTRMHTHIVPFLALTKGVLFEPHNYFLKNQSILLEKTEYYWLRPEALDPLRLVLEF